MVDCDCLPACPFFNDKMKNMPSMAGMMKKRYCQDDYMSCARHIVKVAIGGDKVPIDLYPGQNERVSKIIGSA
ncbi:hypothetical protein MASR2M48_06710 [Spirochaetota bacterium]|jgi:hypothetical protein